MPKVFLMQTQTVQPGSIPAELRAELARQQLSGREFAKRLGVGSMYVARRLNGTVAISAEDLKVFADVLGKPVSFFYGEV